MSTMMASGRTGLGARRGSANPISPVAASGIPNNLLPQSTQRLGQNPMLPAHPQSSDSQYLAEEAILRANMARQYADILQQLGYVDEQGRFIPGQVSVNANRQAGELERSSDLATEQVTNDAQRAGTLFSGRRAVDTSRAQYPFQQQIAQLGVDTPLQLGQLTEQAAGLIDQYTLQNNLLLSQSAARAAALAAQNPGSAPTSTPAQGGGGLPGGAVDMGTGGTGLTGTTPGAITADPNYPNLNQQAPDQVYTPVATGSTTQAEPRPSAGNIIPGRGARTSASGLGQQQGGLPGGSFPTPEVGGQPVLNPPLDQGEFPLNQEQQGDVQQGQFPQLSPEQLATPPAQPAPPPGQVDLSQEQQQQVQNNQFPELDMDALAQALIAALIQSTPNANIAAGQAAVAAPPQIVPGRGRAL